MDQKTVWVLRAEKENDPYKKAFFEGGYEPLFLEVLSFEYVNQGGLAERLKRPAEYSGLVLTSQNAVTAISSTIDLGLLSREQLVAGWSSVPVYAVGGATASAVRAIGLDCVGEESGQADILADFIVSHHQEGTRHDDVPPKRPLLFPCGNLRRDALPEKLKASGFSLEEIVCYNTCVAKDFTLKMSELCKEKGNPQWIVFFSPSGVNHSLKVIDPHLLSRTKICAFGPSTSGALTSAGVAVHVAFSSPYQPQQLAALLADHDDSS
uniref:Uroporphyrinogen-III synthase n=1 Tax=Halisarca dujardinii TaxID=2583056 RepID=A0A6H1QTZ8_HALDU|nr:uroporphyrinogen-III synthase [Halisarca dujardinii]